MFIYYIDRLIDWYQNATTILLFYFSYKLLLLLYDLIDQEVICSSEVLLYTNE
jgi:hypothetical protein